MKSSPRTTISIVAIVLLVFAQAILANAAAASAYPAGAPDTGAICGRVTAGGTDVGIANATVSVVDAGDVSMAYYVGTTDANGYFRFANVASIVNPETGAAENNYKVHAACAYGEGYSNGFGVEPDATAWAGVIVMPAAGAVCGRVTAYNSAAGVANAFVAIVDASDMHHVLFRTRTDASGFYPFANVPSTVDPATGNIIESYKVLALKGLIWHGCSNGFGVGPGSTSFVGVVLTRGYC